MFDVQLKEAHNARCHVSFSDAGADVLPNNFSASSDVGAAMALVCKVLRYDCPFLVHSQRNSVLATLHECWN